MRGGLQVTSGEEWKGREEVRLNNILCQASRHPRLLWSLQSGLQSLCCQETDRGQAVLGLRETEPQSGQRSRQLSGPQGGLSGVQGKREARR